MLGKRLSLGACSGTSNLAGMPMRSRIDPGGSCCAIKSCGPAKEWLIISVPVRPSTTSEMYAWSTKGFAIVLEYVGPALSCIRRFFRLFIILPPATRTITAMQANILPKTMYSPDPGTGTGRKSVAVPLFVSFRAPMLRGEEVEVAVEVETVSVIRCLTGVDTADGSPTVVVVAVTVVVAGRT